MADPAVLKIFHFGRFDIAMCALHLGVVDHAGLLHQDRLQAGPHLHRPARTEGHPDARTGWGWTSPRRSSPATGASRGSAAEQQAYAASDVLHLHALRARLDTMLAREGRTELAQACVRLPALALPARPVAGWEDVDIFAHS